jgi:hypothetical protein
LWLGISIRTKREAKLLDFVQMKAKYNTEVIHCGHLESGLHEVFFSSKTIHKGTNRTDHFELLYFTD